MFILGIYNDPTGFSPLLILLIALVLEAYIGEASYIFRFITHPVELIGSVISLLDRKLNRKKRSNTDRTIRGLISLLIIISLSLIMGYIISWLSLNHPWGWVIELILTTTLLAQRALYNAVQRVAISLQRNSTDTSRKTVSHIVGRDTSKLDNYGVARAAIESLAENFSDGVIAPVFWYILFGFPGLLIYKAVNTMDSMIGYRTIQYKAFGYFAARFDDAMNIIPARLSAFFLILASIFVPTANPIRALKIVLRDATKHQSPNAGWPESAMAGALNLTLAGPRHVKGNVLEAPWIGEGSAKVTHLDIKRSLYLYTVACLINAGSVALLLLFKLILMN